MDPRQINWNLKREHYQLPCREDIEAELAGATLFSKLDANCRFDQIPLDEGSSKVGMFSTLFGRYWFLRFPFGIASAPEVFQKTINEIFESLRRTRVYIDYFLIWGTMKEEHDKRFQVALEVAKRAGLTLIKDKCVFATEEVKFLCDCISKAGITPDPDLTSCTINMPRPSSKLEVQRFLGAVNYFGKFLPNLAK